MGEVERKVERVPVMVFNAKNQIIAPSTDKQTTLAVGGVCEDDVAEDEDDLAVTGRLSAGLDRRASAAAAASFSAETE